MCCINGARYYLGIVLARIKVFRSNVVVVVVVATSVDTDFDHPFQSRVIE